MAKIQNAGVATAACHVLPGRSAEDKPKGLSPPSGKRPIDSGPRRASSHASGARPKINARPTASHAVRHPDDCTIEPTIGNAAMKPMLMTTL